MEITNHIVKCNILTSWEIKLKQFRASQGVHSNFMSRSLLILIDVNGKEHSALGISHIWNTLTNMFLLLSILESLDLSKNVSSVLFFCLIFLFKMKLQMLYFYVTVIYKLNIKVVFNTKKEVCFFVVHPCTSDHTTEGMP